jgi:serine/threonine protein kinase
MFYLLFGKEPFDGTVEEIQAQIELGIDSVLQDLPEHNVSPEAVALLRRLLTVDPEARITAAEALNDPFFAKVVEAQAQLVPSCPSLANFPVPEVPIDMENFQAAAASIADEIVEELVKDGVKLLAFDFDHTVLSIHTFQEDVWTNDVEQRVIESDFAHLCMFKWLVRKWCKASPDHSVGIASFGHTDVVLAYLKRAFGEHVVLPGQEPSPDHLVYFTEHNVLGRETKLHKAEMLMHLSDRGGCAPPEVAFFDDVVQNIKRCNRRGFKAFHVDMPSNGSAGLTREYWRNWVTERWNVSGKVEEEEEEELSDEARDPAEWVLDYKTDPIESTYDLGESLGGGHFSCVQMGTLLEDGETKRAIKVLKKALYVDHKERTSHHMLSRFANEAKYIRSCEHPNVIQCFDTFEDKDNFYIAFEFCPGGNLNKAITKIGENNRKFSEEQAKIVMRQLLDGLRYLHEKKIVHRDLKLANIMFADDTLSSLKIIDFGLACIQKQKTLRSALGQCHYMAPEVLAEGKEGYTSQCDMWSVGVILFAMVYGYMPWGGKKYEFVRDKILEEGFTPEIKEGKGPWFSEEIPISEEARDLIAQLLELDPTARLTADQALSHPWLSDYHQDRF